MRSKHDDRCEMWVPVGDHPMAATSDCWIAILQRTPAMVLPLQSHKTCLSGVRSFVFNIGLLSIRVPSPIQSSGDAASPNQLYKHFSCIFPRREDPEYESLVLTKDMAEIIYHRVEHTDKEGLLCHGLGSQNCPARYKWPPQISQECRSFIVDALRRKVPMQHILQAVRDRALLPYLDGNTFADAVEALLEEKVERDFFVKGQDIRNIRKQVEQEHFILHSNDATSIKLWVEQNPESVLCYSGQKLSNHGTELEPFLLGICTQWQREILAKYGNKRPLCLDATFGTNQYKFSLYTLRAFDDFDNGVLTAWLITSSDAAKHLSLWMKTVIQAVRAQEQEWQPACVIIDDCDAEAKALRDAFEQNIQIVLCIWHVKRAWLKNILKKVRTTEQRVQLFRDLTSIMEFHSCEQDDDHVFSAVQ